MKDKKLIAMLESILLGDFSDALQDNVAHCLSVYKGCRTPEDYEVFYEQFQRLINRCMLYTM